METTEFIIRENGTIIERIIRERKLDAELSVLNALTEEVTRSINNVFSIPDWGTVHANVGLYDTVWSVPINHLPLNARFRLVNGVLVPAFASTTDIEMPLVWQVPKEVHLFFAVQTDSSDNGAAIQGNWLFACDKENRGYRLPLPNLHDDCRLCTGEFNDQYNSGYESVAASLEQFRKSKWNADLMRTIEQSQKFFRFEPTNEAFNTLPIEAKDWTSLCDKVSTAILERVVQ
jgi:hypothetical protein